MRVSRRPAAVATIAVAATVVLGAGPGGVGPLPGVVASAAAAGPSADRAVAGTRTLTRSPSGFPALLRVVASGPDSVVVASMSQGSDGYDYYIDGFAAVPVAGGRPRTLSPRAGGDLLAGASVAGSTFVSYDEFGNAFWVDLRTGAAGSGAQGADPDVWQTAVPGGGAWVTSQGGDGVLASTTTADPDGRPTALADLPGLSAGVAAAADTHGVVAVAGRSVDYYSFVTHAVTRLDTTGAAATLTCDTVTSDAVGCRDGTHVLRLPTDGSAPTVIAASRVEHVVVTATATGWLAGPATAAGLQLSTDLGGTITRTPFPVTGVTAAANGFAYSRITGATARVYSAASATGRPTVLETAAPRPLYTSVLALTAGRVSWIDDSTRHYPVRSRTVRAGGGLHLGPATVTNPGSAADLPLADYGIDSGSSGLAVAGSRALFVARATTTSGLTSGSVVLASGTRRRVVATHGDGDVALSAQWAVWGTTAGHVVARNLASGRTTDVTGLLGVRDSGYGESPSTSYLDGTLSGNRLGYRRKGFAWTLDLRSGRSVRIGPADAGDGSAAGADEVGPVKVAGDWAAWTTATATATVTHYRDVATMGPVRSVPGYAVAGVSAGGLVLSGAQSTVFRRWGSPRSFPLPRTLSVSAPPVVDAGLVAWIGIDGLPKIAPFAPGR